MARRYAGATVRRAALRALLVHCPVCATGTGSNVLDSRVMTGQCGLGLRPAADIPKATSQPRMTSPDTGAVHTLAAGRSLFIHCEVKTAATLAKL